MGASNIHWHDQLPMKSSFIRGNLWLAQQHTAFQKAIHVDRKYLHWIRKDKLKKKKSHQLKCLVTHILQVFSSRIYIWLDPQSTAFVWQTSTNNLNGFLLFKCHNSVYISIHKTVLWQKVYSIIKKYMKTSENIFNFWIFLPAQTFLFCTYNIKMTSAFWYHMRTVQIRDHMT